MNYSVGDIIEYRTFDDSVRMVRVTVKHADVKRGKPGFDGVLIAPSPHPDVWGYDSQIVRVVEPPAGSSGVDEPYETGRMRSLNEELPPL